MGFFAFLRGNATWLAAGFLLTFSSSFGQTFFISIFAGEIRETFGLSNGQWGGIYTIGTSASALVMVWAGVLTDRYRVRSLGRVALIALGIACLTMAVVPSVWALVFVVFALRFTGQGMTSHIAVVAMARWFVASRGKALAVARLGYTLGEAVLPVVFVALLAFSSWRMLWVLVAVVAFVMLPLLAGLLRRERVPSDVSTADHATGMGGRHWTRAAVLRHRLFWLTVPLLLGPAAFGTALFFHQVHLVEVKGWELVRYVALFPVYSGVSLVLMFVSGWAVDKLGTARLIPWMLVPFAVGFHLMGRADGLTEAAFALALMGISSGAGGTIPAAFWAEFYGTRHLGAIKSMAAAVMVFGSAIGPGLTGALIDFGYPFPTQMSAIAVYFLVAAGLMWLGIRSVAPSTRQNSAN